MQFKELYGWSGKYDIIVRDKKTGKMIRHDVIDNIITNGALNEIIKCVYDSPPDIEWEYAAIGTDNSAVAVTQTTLGTEVFRTAFISKDYIGVGEAMGVALIFDTDYAGAIEEIGIFCGSGASAVADSGLMLSRILWSHNKTATEEIQITRIDKINRA